MTHAGISLASSGPMSQNWAAKLTHTPVTGEGNGAAVIGPDHHDFSSGSRKKKGEKMDFIHQSTLQKIRTSLQPASST